MRATPAFLTLTGAALLFCEMAAAQTPATSPSPTPSASPSPPASRPGTVFEWKDGQSQGDHRMEFRLWIPAGLTRARAVISLAPGYAGDGRNLANDPEFQALAERTGAALLGCLMRGNDYAKASQWSGAVLLHAIRELSGQSAHPEIAEAPLAMWGISAGGMFNYNFACWKPERVAVFIVNKGGYYDGRAEGAVLGVPGIWFAGCKDEDYRLQGVTDFFTAGRRMGAPWCLAMEPNAGHEIGRTKQMGIFYLETMMTLRLGTTPTNDPAAPPVLRSLGNQPWTGTLSNHEIRPFDPQLDSRRVNSWLPDELTAKRWQAFVNGTPFPTPEASP